MKTYVKKGILCTLLFLLAITGIFPPSYSYVAEAKTKQDQLYPVDKWSYEFEDETIIDKAVGSHDTLFVTTTPRDEEYEKLYAFSKDGTQLWTYRQNISYNDFSQIHVSQDGTIYLRSLTKLVAINTNGQEKWSYSLENAEWGPTGFGLAFGSGGTIYLDENGSNGSKMIALSSSGTKKWEYTLENSWADIGYPVANEDGTLYFSDSYGKVYAVNTGGNVNWILSLSEYDFPPSELFSSGTIDSDGTIYIIVDRKLYALDPSGKVKWSFAKPVYGKPVLSPDGTILVTDYLMENLYAVNRNGKLKWSIGGDDLHGDSMVTVPVVKQDGTVLVGTPYFLFAFSKDGTKKWQLTKAGNIHQPVLGNDGTLYLSTNIGKLFSIGEDDKGNVVAVDYVFPSKIMFIGETFQPRVVFTYMSGATEDITDKVEWEVSDEDILQVGDDGTITSIGKGEAYIVATHNGWAIRDPLLQEERDIVVVSPSDITNLKLDETRVSLSVGNKKQLSLKATIGKNTSIEANTRATWTSADPSVVEVKDGQLIAKKKGTTVVTAELASKKVQLKVEVKEKTLKSMKASKTKVILNSGEQYQVQVIATYSDKTTENITSRLTWSAGSGKAATVENGLITAIAKGKETIKGTYGKKRVSIVVTVK